jgi:L-ribulose-5-phosphate 3-epimerase
MSLIGIMQGRLLPPQGGRFQCFPVERWREEFPAAVAAGLDAVEWIYDLQGAHANPLATDQGISEVKALSRRHGIAVVSVCADYFMDRPFVRAMPGEFAELTAHLGWLIERCHLAGFTRMVLPFVDRSRIDTPEELECVVGTLRRVLPIAARAGLEIHLETSLEPQAFADLMSKLPDPQFKANYDSGNSSSLGYDVRQELAAYGMRIGSVHIKDRVRGGDTVPLGTGNADIPALLAGLNEIEYSGDYVLQVARGMPGREVEWARKNREFLTREVGRAKVIACGGSL